LKLIVTEKCASHRYNQSYQTLLIEFDGSEDNVRPYGHKFNWQPKDSEFMAVVKTLVELSPTFRSDLIDYVYSLNTWTSVKPKRVVTNLAEAML